MFCGLNAKNHCLISNIENLVAKIRSVKFSFLLSIDIVSDFLGRMGYLEGKKS